MPGKIFLNYRRSDADAWADRVYGQLMTQFLRDVFMDVDGNIPFGLPWADSLDSQVADLMLVLIGCSWVAEFEARSGPGEREQVRVEIESALARKIPVVPVFLGDAPVPSPASLPASIHPLLELQAMRLQRASLEADAKALIPLGRLAGGSGESGRSRVQRLCAHPVLRPGRRLRERRGVGQD
jgi:hypothetical protein